MKVDKFDYKKEKEAVLNVIYELFDKEQIDGENSFSDGNYKKEYSDFLNDISIVEKELKKEYSLDLSTFMTKYKSEIYHDPAFTDSNAFFDILLYAYDKEESELYGISLLEADPIEHLIKYTYEYFNYDMGKRYLLQSYDSIPDYFEGVANNLLNGLLSSDYGYKQLQDLFSPDYKLLNKIKKLCTVVKKYNNGTTLYVDLNYLISELEKSGAGNASLEEVENALEEDLIGVEYNIEDGVAIIYFGDKNDISKNEFTNMKQNFNIGYSANKYNL